MNDEITKAKYRVLQKNLYTIKNRLFELEDIYENTISNVKNSFLIDKKIVFEEEFNQIKMDFTSIKEQTLNEIIPNINNKI